MLRFFAFSFLCAHLVCAWAAPASGPVTGGRAQGPGWDAPLTVPHLPRPYMHCLSFLRAAAGLELAFTRSFTEAALKKLDKFLRDLSVFRPGPEPVPHENPVTASSHTVDEIGIASVKGKVSSLLHSFDDLDPQAEEKMFAVTLRGKAAVDNFEAARRRDLEDQISYNFTPFARSVRGITPFASAAGPFVFATALAHALRGTPIPLETIAVVAAALTLVAPHHAIVDKDFPRRQRELDDFLETPPGTYAWHYDSYRARVDNTLVDLALHPLDALAADASDRALALVYQSHARNTAIRGEQLAEATALGYYLSRAYRLLARSDRSVSFDRVIIYDPSQEPEQRWSLSLAVRVLRRRPRPPVFRRAPEPAQIRSGLIYHLAPVPAPILIRPNSPLR